MDQSRSTVESTARPSVVPEGQVMVVRVDMVKAITTIVSLLVFVFGVDPLFIWLSLKPLLDFGHVYDIWLAVLSMGITLWLVYFLLHDRDKGGQV